MSLACRLAVVLMIVCGLSPAAYAQQGARVSGFYAGAIGEGETNSAAGGSVGYRFTPRLGFDFEALALPDFEIEDSADGGRGVAFLSNFVTEFPSPASWLTPYVQGGGGVANIRFGSTYELEDRNGQRAPFPNRGRRGAFPVIPDDMRVVRTGLQRSQTNLTLSVGGGVDFSVWRGLAFGPNITFMKFFGNQDLDLTRIGVRTTYRF
jgi:Outer membrane protein beta-barrel domain